MSNNKLGQEPVFPRPTILENGKIVDIGAAGASKRFYVACAAMSALISSSNDESLEKLVKEAYLIADIMLENE